MTYPPDRPIFRALMVTDIVQFTSILDDLGDVRGLALLRSHDVLLRSCLQQHAGVEIAHTGDGMITSFAQISAAVSCATAIQRGLARIHRAAHEPALSVRIGVHAGWVMRQEERLFGKSVNIAVRVCASAEGGQVVASHTVLRARGEIASPLDPLGARQLKGIAEPIRLFDVLWQANTARPEVVPEQSCRAA